MPVSEIDFYAEIDSIHQSATARILMRYVESGNLSQIANDASAPMRLSAFEFSKFENLRARIRVGHADRPHTASKGGKQEIAYKNRAFQLIGKSHDESMVRPALSQSLSVFHLYCIWARPRASAPRDICFFLCEVHVAFFVASSLFFFRRP
jgi:hypothetical protein